MTRAERTAWRESQRFTREAVREAQAAAGITGQELAALLGISHPQLCRQLAEPDPEETDESGDVDDEPWHEHLSVQRLMRVQNPRFWLVMLTKFRARFGVQEDTSELAHASRELLLGISRYLVVLTRACMTKRSDHQRQRQKAS